MEDKATDTALRLSSPPFAWCLLYTRIFAQLVLSVFYVCYSVIADKGSDNSVEFKQSNNVVESDKHVSIAKDKGWFNTWVWNWRNLNIGRYF